MKHFKKPSSKSLFGALNPSGFTLIEIVVVISVLATLAAMVIPMVGSVGIEGRDAKRKADMKQFVTALQRYIVYNGTYPSISSDGCCDGWDQSPCNGNRAIASALKDDGIISDFPSDPGRGSGTGCYGYNYYQYGAGSYGCDASRGNFYVIGVRDMETSTRPHPDSPGWNCPGRDWQAEFDWVTGAFER